MKLIRRIDTQLKWIGKELNPTTNTIDSPLCYKVDHMQFGPAQIEQDIQQTTPAGQQADVSEVS